MDNIQCIVLECGIVLISGIEQVTSELGEPDCKLVDPYSVNILVRRDSIKSEEESEIHLKKWLSEYTDDGNIMMISSDKILTILEPSKILLGKYLTEIGKE